MSDDGSYADDAYSDLASSASLEDEVDDVEGLPDGVARPASPSSASGESDGDGAAESDEEAAPSSAPQARPQRPAVDALVRRSNTALTVVVVPPGERVTDERVQPPEAARLMAMRAQQIADHGTHFALEAEGEHDPAVLAYLEFFQRRCPLILRRQVGTAPDGAPIVEDWDPKLMVLPDIPPPIAPAGRTRGGA